MDNIRYWAGSNNIKLAWTGTVSLVAFWCIPLPFIVDVIGFIYCFCIGVVSIIKILWFRNRHTVFMVRRFRKHHLWISVPLTLILSTFLIWLQLLLVLPAPEISSTLPLSLRRLRKDCNNTATFAEVELSYLHGAAAASTYTCLVAACRVPVLGASSINRTWSSIQRKMVQNGSPSLSLNMSQREAGCWRQNLTILDRSSVLENSISEASMFEDFRHDTIELANDLATYTIKVVRLESAVDVTINQAILESLNDIQRLLNSTRISTASCSAYTPCLDRLIAFYSSSPLHLSFWNRRFFHKSLPLYTHLRPYLFPNPTPTESLSEKLRFLIAKVTSSHEIRIALANVRDAYFDTAPKIQKIIDDYGKNKNIPVEIRRRFEPMANLLRHIRDGSTTQLSNSVSISKQQRSEPLPTNWWGVYLEQVIFRKIWVELEKLGEDIEEIRVKGKWIEGTTWRKLLGWEGWVEGLE
ncbi:hypothetical protein AC578_2190 [Pseudocercospora eumusae]|uniref:Uncharacterized protein n=1 Tax=Pseudocercospora eumusae TaxID=321146 RepID=A0A139GYK7_9PEZI|nr:hypothetical protein AC578_2190 [Pseudocercospora eumusae]